MSERPRTTVFIATSLDGFIARPDGGLDWLPTEADPDLPDEDFGYAAHMASVDALLMGRSTYDVVRGFGGDWPYGQTPVHVLTSHAEDLDPPADGVVHAVSGSPEQILASLASTGVDHVYVDGGAVVQQFLAAGVLDRLIITVIPVLIGEGIRLFGPSGGDITLWHQSSRAWSNGMAQHVYDLAPPKS